MCVRKEERRELRSMEGGPSVGVVIARNVQLQSKTAEQKRKKTVSGDTQAMQWCRRTMERMWERTRTSRFGNVGQKS